MFVLSATLPRGFAAVHHVNFSTLTTEPDRDPPTPPAVPARAPKPFDAEGRRERGLEIAGTRAIVGFGNVYLVAPSKPGTNPYVVQVTPAGVICDCPDYRYRCASQNRDCKHGIAVLVQIAAALPLAA